MFFKNVRFAFNNSEPHYIIDGSLFIDGQMCGDILRRKLHFKPDDLALDIFAF